MEANRDEIDGIVVLVPPPALRVIGITLGVTRGGVKAPTYYGN